jgi:RNA ligase (TIGR02306 family)
MATFEAKVYRLEIEPHPNADAIELAKVGEFRSIVRKGQFKTGDLGVYIPEASIVPLGVIKILGLEGKLAGSQKNRVKAIKLRGILSQGLIYPVDSGTDCGGPFITLPTEDGIGTMLPVVEGQDVATELGITKYEPPIPVHFAGQVGNAHGYTLHYDIENIKKYPNVINYGTDVLFVTEKLHGTWTCFGYHPEYPEPIVTSKGLSGRGVAFKLNEENQGNVYVQMYKKVGEKYLADLRAGLAPGLAVYLLGEIYGKGVQDLQYGTTEPAFRAFDIYVKDPTTGEGRYLSGVEFVTACRAANIPTVPVVGIGPYTREEIEEMTNGQTELEGDNIREGVVVRLYADADNIRYDRSLGRIILKSVSEAYLLRKGNVTEFN